MRYPWIDGYLMAKRGVTKDLQAEWNWIRYHIGGKMFAAILLDPSDRPYYINLKLEPLEGELMRRQYPDIIPGYYSNKQHWNSVKPDGDVPDELLKKLLDRSYDLVFKSLAKKKQMKSQRAAFPRSPANDERERSKAPPFFYACSSVLPCEI